MNLRFPPIRPRQPLLGAALAAVAGIILADFLPAPAAACLAASALLAATAFFRPRTWLAWLTIAAAFFSLHQLRHHHGEGATLAAWLGEQPRPATVRAIVWSEPTQRTGKSGVRWRFRGRLEELTVDGVKIPTHALADFDIFNPTPLTYGDRIEAVATLHPLTGARNPGQFDFAAYRLRQGVHFEVRTKSPRDLSLLGRHAGRPLIAFGLQARAWLQTQLARDLDDSPEIAALISSMTLGLRGQTPDEVQDLFQKTGTLHLFAVSGLNVAMLAFLLAAFLKPLGIGRRTSVAIIIPVIILYAVITGLSASSLRAAIMAIALSLALLFDRRGAALNCLAAAALLILLWNTNELFSPGFQFSFILVLVLLALAGGWQRRLHTLGLPDPFLPRRLWNLRQRLSVYLWGHVSSALAVTAAAWIGSLALTAGYFHLISPAALFANLAAVPLAFLILALGLLSALTGGLLPAAAVLFNNANWACAQLLLATVQFFASLPGGHVYVQPSALLPSSTVEITVLDVDGGGALHLRHAGRDWLIDCGPARLYSGVLLPYLRSAGINRLDGLIATHGDSEHIGASPALLRDFRPRLVCEPLLPDRSRTRQQLQSLLAASEKNAPSPRRLRRGDTLQLGPECRARILFPPADLQRSRADDKALVLMIETPAGRALLTADAGFATEQWLLENEPDLRADVYLKGHHTSDLSGTDDFLLRVQPSVVICTALRYGQPPSTLDPWSAAVRARGITLYRQDESGAVSVKIRRDLLEARPFLRGQPFSRRHSAESQPPFVSPPPPD